MRIQYFQRQEIKIQIKKCVREEDTVFMSNTAVLSKNVNLLSDRVGVDRARDT